MLLDLADPTEAHVADRLLREPILWLATVSGSGRPHQVPVWFCWRDPVVTLFSRPDTAKTGHLRVHGAVGLALDTAADGTDVVTAEGDARLVGLDDIRDALGAFGEKYAPLLGDAPLDGWLSTFSQPVVVTVSRLVAWSSPGGMLDYRSLPRT